MTLARTDHRLLPTPAIAPSPDTIAAVEQLAQVAARLLLELESGRRPLAQIQMLVSPSLLQRLERRCRPRPDGTRPRGPGAARIRSARPTWPTPQVCETCVVVDDGVRVTAVAVRVEWYRGGWRITEMTRPDERP